MADNEPNTGKPAEPRGFGEHSRGLAGEYAHEQGWGLDEQERMKQPSAPEDADGGGDYDYGARDFGDQPVNTSIGHDLKTQDQPAPSEVVTGKTRE